MTDSQTDRQPDQDADGLPVPRRWRFLISVLVIGHLLAVFAPPLAFQTRGPRGISPSVVALLWPVERYAQLIYLDRGYAFFAPDPGPSHLLRARWDATQAETPEPTDDSAEASATFDHDGAGQNERLFPNLDDQWPRLLYHRHFMLAEFLNDAYQPALPAEASVMVGPDLPIDALRQLRDGRRRYDAIAGSMANHLKEEFQCDRVTLERLEHSLPDFVGFLEEEIHLDDPRSFVPLTDEPVSMEALLPGGDSTAMEGRRGEWGRGNSLRDNRLPWLQTDSVTPPGRSAYPSANGTTAVVPGAEPVPTPESRDRDSRDEPPGPRESRQDAAEDSAEDTAEDTAEDRLEDAAEDVAEEAAKDDALGLQTDSFLDPIAPETSPPSPARPSLKGDPE